jgi:hypothetical protein
MISNTAVSLAFSRRARGAKHNAPVLLLLLLLTAYYVFQVTVGTFATLGWNTHYYDLAARGFRAGHLYLELAPPPELLALANPYDPFSSYRKLWLWDALLFHGRYYIYWGPVPALCVLAFRALSGFTGTVHDQWLVLCFMLGRLYGGAALILSLARHSAPRPPAWAVWLAIALFALASPTPFVIARPVIYEASVGAGQCFLFWALFAAFWGVVRSRWRVPALFAAGTLLGLAVNSRVTMVMLVPWLFLFTAFALWRRSGRSLRRVLPPLAAFATPLALSGLAAAYYNYARFGSIGDFGVAYQLTGRQFSSSLGYVLPNLASYSFAELEWSCRFPFAQLSVHRTLTTLFLWPADYDVGGWELGERVGGLLVTVSCCWLVPCVLAFRYLQRLRLRLMQAPGAQRPLLAPLDQWLLACALTSVAALGPALSTWTGSMRYLEDAAGGCVLGSIVVAFSLLRRAAQGGSAWRGRLARFSFIALAAHTLLVGVLLGFSGHNDSFRRQNSPLYSALVQRLSICD